MFALIQKLWKDESGQGVPEYALIVAFVAVMVALVGALWGTQMQTLVTTVGTRITGALP
jgi:Flp pilus assembly pilin Flp